MLKEAFNSLKVWLSLINLSHNDDWKLFNLVSIFYQSNYQTSIYWYIATTIWREQKEEQNLKYLSLI